VLRASRSATATNRTPQATATASPAQRSGEPRQHDRLRPQDGGGQPHTPGCDPPHFPVLRSVKVSNIKRPLTIRWNRERRILDANGLMERRTRLSVGTVDLMVRYGAAVALVLSSSTVVRVACCVSLTAISFTSFLPKLSVRRGREPLPENPAPCFHLLAIHATRLRSGCRERCPRVAMATAATTTHSAAAYANPIMMEAIPDHTRGMRII
jgi:hypothetical protein